MLDTFAAFALSLAVGLVGLACIGANATMIWVAERRKWCPAKD